MKRPDGFDPRPPAPPVEEDTEPRHVVKARISKLPSLPKRAQREPREPRPAKRTRQRPEPSEAELAAKEARASARAARRDARRAAAERRRFERSEVRRFTRRARNRRMAWIAAGGVVTVFATLIAVAVYSPLLALQEIRVTGTARLDAEQLSEAVDSQLGTPLALLDFDKLTDDLSEFPLIRSYVTEAVPPHTLVIHVVERQPVASVMASDGYVLVDPAGVEIERTEARPAGVPLVEVEEEEIGGDVFDAIIEVLLALPEPLLPQVDQVSATTMDDVTLKLAGVGQRIVWGSADRAELKARVLERLMAAHDPGASVEFDVTAPLSAVVRPL
ncbi:MAG: FtsQ-type POTRA domain-containing protein [Salinibacterium sp.]|nr:FtsQ-type POTRA domain-containing protein [Salinibacterium sp.]